MGGRAKDHNQAQVDGIGQEVDYLVAITGFPADRLCPIVSRTARVAATENAARVLFVPSLRTALNHLPADKAVSLFGKSNAENLAWRELLFRRLKTTGAAHTKSDLAAFLSRLSRKPKQSATAPSPHNSELGNWASYYGRFVYRGHACSSASGSPHLPTEWREQVSSAGESLSKVISPISDRLCHGISDGEDGGTALGDCLDMIERNLSPDAAGLLLAIDRLVTGYDVFAGLTSSHSGLRVAGGLTDVLEIIGHCTEEMSVGVFDQTTAALGDLIDRRFRGLPRLRVSGFYQAISCGRGCEANCACDTFSCLREQCADHWAAFRNHLHARFTTTNDYVVALETAPAVRPDPTNYAPLDPFLRSDRPRDTLAAILTKEVDFAFYQCGDIWVVRYGSEYAALEHLVGLRYISILLHNPHKNISSTDLVIAVGGTSIDPNLRNEYGSAQQHFDVGSAQRLLEAHISDFEKIRKSVSNAISRARKSIKAHCPKLAQHLDNTLDIGHSCRYQPEPRIHWTLD